MYKVILSTIAVLVMTASAFTTGLGRVSQPSSPLAANAAYRDGLFMGGFAARNGMPNRLSVGRWVSTDDRANYAAGYQQAYRNAKQK